MSVWSVFYLVAAERWIRPGARALKHKSIRLLGRTGSYLGGVSRSHYSNGLIALVRFKQISHWAACVRWIQARWPLGGCHFAIAMVIAVHNDDIRIKYETVFYDYFIRPGINTRIYEVIKWHFTSFFSCLSFFPPFSIRLSLQLLPFVRKYTAVWQ